MTDYSEIDPVTVVHLDDGWHAAMCVDSDGEAWPWLISPEHTCHTHGGCRAKCCAPHEQPGRLPRAVRARISPCHATVRHGERRGQPCSTPAPPGERYCAQHRHRADTGGA